MLRHIVMIKLKSSIDIKLVSNELLVMLNNLENSVDSLLKIETGLNVSVKPSAYDVVLTADFRDEAGLDSYRVHPEHVKVLDYLKIVMEKAVVVDYIN